MAVGLYPSFLCSDSFLFGLRVKPATDVHMTQVNGDTDCCFLIIKLKRNNFRAHHLPLKQNPQNMQLGIILM